MYKRLKVPKDFLDYVEIDLPIKAITHHSICIEYKGSLCLIDLLDSRPAYIPLNVSLSAVSTVRVNISTGEIIKIY